MRPKKKSKAILKMPSTNRIVINTGPLLAIVAATGDLEVLKNLYREVLVPREVADELRAGGATGFGLARFEEANWLAVESERVTVNPYLSNTLDLGEAAVIQLALDRNVETVCIDETVGRRVARLNNLQLTGSIGVLLKAKKEGASLEIARAIENMKSAGIWVSERVAKAAIALAGE
jgi:predicted nucleic acid-binding protein